MSASFSLEPLPPPLLKRLDGTARRVGVELEVAGLDRAPLPQLPLAVRNGFLVAAGDFPEGVGPSWWGVRT